MEFLKFGRKPASKEEYLKQEKEVERLDTLANSDRGMTKEVSTPFTTVVGSSGGVPGYGHGEAISQEFVPSQAQKDYEKADKKREAMIDDAHSEGLKLNKEYNKLLQNLADAQNAVSRFEKEQLGMNKE